MHNFTDEQVPDQSGKTLFVTGANAGIGLETARVLAGKGARVLMGCRNPQKAQAAVDSIKTLHPSADLNVIELDLGDLESVRAAARRVQQEPRLDVLINNAGIMTPPLEYTAQGHESQFGVNHLGPFVLTCLLLETLKKTPGARVVNTSSLAHRTGKINFADLAAKVHYNTNSRYSQSKLANLLFSYELQRRLQQDGADVISVACHPGIADTELSRHMPSWFKVITPLVRVLFNTPAKGAWPTLMAATASTVRGGDYCGPAKLAQTAGPATIVRSAAISKDQALAKQLWDVSVELTGVNML